MKNSEKGFVTPKRLLWLLFLLAFVSVALLAVGVFRTFKKPGHQAGSAENASGQEVEILSPDGKPGQTAVVGRDIVLQPAGQIEEAAQLPAVESKSKTMDEFVKELGEKAKAKKVQESAGIEQPAAVQDGNAEENVSHQEQQEADRERLAEQRRIERVEQAKAELEARARRRQAEESAPDEAKTEAKHKQQTPKEVIDNLF